MTIPEGDPKSSAIQINFAAKPFDCLLGVMAIWSAGVLSWTQTWTVQPDQGVAVVKVLSIQKSHNNLCGVWVLFTWVQDAKVEAS